MSTMNNSASAAVTAPNENVSPPFPVEPDDAIFDTDAADDESSQPSQADEGAETDAQDADTVEATDDGDGAPAEEGDGDTRNKVPAKKRIQQLSARAREFQARAEAAEAREAALIRQHEQLEKRERPGEAADYESDAAYAEALVKEAVAAAKADALKTAREEVATEKENLKRSAWIEKTETKRKEAPDFDAVITNPRAAITNFMRDAIIGEDNGADVAYYLGKNPDKASEIARLSPIQQVAAIGRLAERFSAAPQPKRTTQAPAPRAKLAGHGSPQAVNLAKMTDAEYRAHRVKQNAERAKNGR